jgi:hypothetical protein
VTARRSQRLYAAQPVRMRVGCDRACDLRVALSGRGSDLTAVTRSLARAGTVNLRLQRWDGRSPKAGRQRVRVLVRATAPAGHEVVPVSRSVLVVARPALPVPALGDVRAVRRGRSIVVTWHTASAARRVYFLVYAQHGRRLTSASFRDRKAIRLVRGRGRTRFRVRLHPQHPDRIRFVRIDASSIDGRGGHHIVVPVD